MCQPRCPSQSISNTLTTESSIHTNTSRFCATQDRVSQEGHTCSTSPHVLRDHKRHHVLHSTPLSCLGPPRGHYNRTHHAVNLLQLFLPSSLFSSGSRHQRLPTSVPSSPFSSPLSLLKSQFHSLLWGWPALSHCHLLRLLYSTFHSLNGWLDVY